ncbi:MAG TPA: L,D-transpeptidase, partial [Solirubrobacterales bacterium]|nr:L,D-transpeptidase [Solirubrobacterales bacterium]
MVGQLPTGATQGAGEDGDRLRLPRGFVGPWALPLTLLSDKLHHFEGGEGRVAIHGRDGASLLNPLGTAASHGCIRVPNAEVRWMAAH